MALEIEKFKQLLSHYSLDKQALWDACRPLKEVKVVTGQAIIRAGEQQQYIFLIEQGLVRYYYTSPEGKEWNKAFFREGQLVGSISAQLTQSPCRFTIEAIEPCVLYSTPFTRFWELAEAQELLQQTVQEVLLRNEFHEGILLTGNAEARYRWLEQKESWLLERGVSLFHLASYLGMEAVTLSRVRCKLKAMKK